MTTPNNDQLREYAQKATYLAQANMIALMGIADIKDSLLRMEGDTVNIGRMLKKLDNLQLEIIKAREGDF
jgi:hypothetical protein